MVNSQVKRLMQLPQRVGDAWFGGITRLPAWVVGVKGNSSEPMFVAMWASILTGKVGGGHPGYDVGFAAAFDALVDFAVGERVGYRPGKVYANDPALAEYMKPLLEEANIGVVYDSSMPDIEKVVQAMDESAELDDDTDVDVLDGVLGDMPGYLAGKDVTLSQIRAFAEAAESYYLAAPSRNLVDEDLIEIESPEPPYKGLRFASVMSGGEVQNWLAFFSSQEQFWGSKASDDMDKNDKTNADNGGWMVMFGGTPNAPDGSLWRENQLPLADELAFPIAVKFNPLEMRSPVTRPDAKTLTFFEGMMRALAVTTEDEMDTGRWSKTVTTVDGPMEFTLSLPFFFETPSPEVLYTHGLSNHRSMDVAHSQMWRFLQDHEFPNIDELKKAVHDEFAGKPCDAEKYAPRTPKEAAQTLCYEAFGSIGRRKIMLAKKALKLYPDCAEAFVILGENAHSAEAAGEFFAAGVQAGRRSLGEQIFEENVGMFWKIFETRPYMRALDGLGAAQNTMGKSAEAIATWQEVLRLNPNDNQGVRDNLLPLLIAEGQLEPAEKLLADYEGDECATWQFCRALLTFAREGDTKASRKQLKEAVANNRHVPGCLLQIAKTGESLDQPRQYSFGTPEEAVMCANSCIGAWEATSGAIEWLRTNGKKSQRSKQQTKPGRKKAQRSKKKK